jgi:hypothetical protein
VAIGYSPFKSKKDRPHVLPWLSDLSALRQFFGNATGSFDVPILAALVASADQDDYRTALLYEVDAVTRAVVYPQLPDPPAHVSNVAWIAQRHPPYPQVYARPSAPVTQPGKPASVLLRLADFDGSVVHCHKSD